MHLDGIKWIKFMIKVLGFDLMVNSKQFNFKCYIYIYILNKRTNILWIVLTLKNNISITIILGVMERKSSPILKSHR